MSSAAPNPGFVCTACRQPMDRQLFFDFPVHVCRGCRALFLKETTLNKIVRVPRPVCDPATPPAQRTPFDAAMLQPSVGVFPPTLQCPRCRKPLRRQIYRGSAVPADMCYPCTALLLTPGTLPLIYDFTHSPVRAARRAEIEHLFREHTRNMESFLDDLRRNAPLYHPGGLL